MDTGRQVEGGTSGGWESVNLTEWCFKIGCLSLDLNNVVLLAEVVYSADASRALAKSLHALLEANERANRTETMRIVMVGFVLEVSSGNNAFRGGLDRS